MRKRFCAGTLSEAKTKALKWFGKNVMGNKDLSEIMCRFEIDADAEFPGVLLVLFVELDVSEVKNKHCQICQEFHKSFFINENCNCQECKMMGLNNRMHDMLTVKKSFYREKLKKALEANAE